MTRRVNSVVMATAALFAVLCSAGVSASPLPITPNGDISVPAIEVPSSSMYSDAGNSSRVEHILTKRGLKGKPVPESNAALFGPRLERSKAAFAVTIRKEVIAGVDVLIYEPAAGITADKRGKLMINVHGGGFPGCFVECGGLESIPVAALTGLRVISIDYRESPEAQFPAASQDVAAVYAELLKEYTPRGIGLYGCSAGGILTAHSLVWFQRHGLPRPAAAGIFCAGGDAAMGGDSRMTGALLGDGELPAVAAKGASLGYMSGSSPTDP